jgi:UDP-N-acetyl-D-mannosaminuronic acid transferase (WecB/TagA/CpsF family)
MMKADTQSGHFRTVSMRSLVLKCRLADAAELNAIFQELLELEGPVSVGFLNQHGYNLARRDPVAYDAFDSLDVMFRDGIGMALACKAFGLDAKDNLNGTDLIPALVEYASSSLGPRVQFFAYGTAEPWLKRGGDALFNGRDFHSLDGFREPAEYLQHFRAHMSAQGQAVVVLGMGMPKQEVVASLFRTAIQTDVLLICGGAILDFKARRFTRAPRFLLLLEPRRLFNRYVIGIPAFLLAVAKDRR